MAMHLRACAAYNIIKNDIANSDIIEILFWSGWVKYSVLFFDIYKIIEILENGTQYKAPVDATIEQFYEDKAKFVLDNLSELGTLEQIISAIWYYKIECSIFYSHLNIMKITNPARSWSQNTIGFVVENNTIELFKLIYGYEVEQIQRAKLTWQIAGKSVCISGRPDGLIVSSPGKIYNNYILEIKYHNRAMRIPDKTMAQIVIYSMIYERPVMLVIFDKFRNIYKIYKYSIKNLKEYWDNTMRDSFEKNIANLYEKLYVDSPQKACDLAQLLG